MSRLWDTPEFWARSETDEMLREMSDADPDALADSFECNLGSYDDDPELAVAIVGELRRRAAAGIRFWPEPHLHGAEPKNESAEKASPAWVSSANETIDVTDEDIPW